MKLQVGDELLFFSEAGSFPAYVAALRGGADADGRVRVRPAGAGPREGLEEATLGDFLGGYGPLANVVVAGRDIRGQASRARVAALFLDLGVEGRGALSFPDGSETQGWVNRGGTAVEIHFETAIDRAQTWAIRPGADKAGTLGGARLLIYGGEGFSEDEVPEDDVRIADLRVGGAGAVWRLGGPRRGKGRGSVPVGREADVARNLDVRGQIAVLTRSVGDLQRLVEGALPGPGALATAA